jgi:hypothetical protein
MDDECILVTHYQSCCVRFQVGIPLTQKSAFDALESECLSVIDCRGWGCPGGTEAEGGDSPGIGQSIVAACINGACRAVVR